MELIQITIIIVQVYRPTSYIIKPTSYVLVKNGLNISLNYIAKILGDSNYRNRVSFI